MWIPQDIQFAMYLRTCSRPLPSYSRAPIMIPNPLRKATSFLCSRSIILSMVKTSVITLSLS